MLRLVSDVGVQAERSLASASACTMKYETLLQPQAHPNSPLQSGPIVPI